MRGFQTRNSLSFILAHKKGPKRDGKRSYYMHFARAAAKDASRVKIFRSSLLCLLKHETLCTINVYTISLFDGSELKRFKTFHVAA
jgi:hypothetical protein